MIRLRVADVLEQRGWTAYRLAREAKISMPVAYRLAKRYGNFRRLDLVTLDVLCQTLSVQPGDLLEYVPDRKKVTSDSVRLQPVRTDLQV